MQEVLFAATFLIIAVFIGRFIEYIDKQRIGMSENNGHTNYNSSDNAHVNWQRFKSVGYNFETYRKKFGTNYRR